MYTQPSPQGSYQASAALLALEQRQAFSRWCVSGACALRGRGVGVFACLVFFLNQSPAFKTSLQIFLRLDLLEFSLFADSLSLSLRKAWPVETEVRQPLVREGSGRLLGDTLGWPPTQPRAHSGLWGGCPGLRRWVLFVITLLVQALPVWSQLRVPGAACGLQHPHARRGLSRWQICLK